MDGFPPVTLTLIQWRYCLRCRALKPPRTHHCSTCSRCVLRLDHHCPWVGNCVGIHNHKHFLMFLIHAAIGCLIVASVMLHYLYTSGMKTAVRQSAHYVSVPMTSAALVLSLGGLLGFHSYLLLNNLSTLEIDQLEDLNVYNRIRKVVKTAAEKRAARGVIKMMFGVRRRGVVPSKPDACRQMKQVVDYKRNWADVMGNDWKYWAIPCSSSESSVSHDGINWHLRQRD